MKLLGTLKKQDWILIAPMIILALYLIIRLVDKSSIIHSFPLDFANDLSSHLAKLHFLSEYGFHAIVPNWYFGMDYVLFRSYPPGWYFFALPLYKILENVQLATYISIISIYVLSFIAILFIGRQNGFSKLRSSAYFLLLYANPISIGYLLRLGKPPELTGWLIGLIVLGILLYYKNNKFDWKFYSLSFMLSIWVMSNFTSLIACLPLFLGFFLILKNRTKIHFIIMGFFAILLASPWLFPFISHILAGGGITDEYFTRFLLSPETKMDQYTTWISSTILFITFFFYWVSKKKSKKELIFFGPVLVLALLVFNRMVVYTPLFNHLTPDNFNILFLIISIYFFLSTEIPKKYLKLSSIFLVIGVGTLVIISSFYTPFEASHSSLQKDSIELLEKADGVLLITGTTYTYSKALYSYGAIYHNTSTIWGWMDLDIPKEKLEQMKEIGPAEAIQDCEKYKKTINEFNVEYVLTYHEFCDLFTECGFNTVETKNNACLLNLED
jgi:hypothetical protein